MRKVAILGTAPLSRDLAPFDDQEYEIWVCSAGNIGNPNLKRITRWFELHAMTELEAPENKSWSANYLKWLRDQTFPVWMLEKNDLVPQAQVFPCQELLAEFGREWFTSSVAWMQALAIYEKFNEIGIFGVDMAADQEHYTGQRMGCRRFIEIGAERGIKTVIPWESCLGNPPPIYGLSEATPMGRRINVTEQMLVAKRGEIAATEDRMKMEKCFFDGALEQLRYFKRTFCDGADAFKHMDLALAPELEKAAQASVDAAIGAAPHPVSLPDGASIAPSNVRSSGMRLTPPPAFEPGGALNGKGGGEHRARRKTRQRPSEGLVEAI